MKRKRLNTEQWMWLTPPWTHPVCCWNIHGIFISTVALVVFVFETRKTMAKRCQLNRKTLYGFLVSRSHQTKNENKKANKKRILRAMACNVHFRSTHSNEFVSVCTHLSDTTSWHTLKLSCVFVFRLWPLVHVTHSPFGQEVTVVRNMPARYCLCAFACLQLPLHPIRAEHICNLKTKINAISLLAWLSILLWLHIVWYVFDAILIFSIFVLFLANYRRKWRQWSETGSKI